MWSLLVRRHLSDLLRSIFQSSFTHITHYKSCWTFLCGLDTSFSGIYCWSIQQCFIVANLLYCWSIQHFFIMAHSCFDWTRFWVFNIELRLNLGHRLLRLDSRRNLESVPRFAEICYFHSHVYDFWRIMTSEKESIISTLPFCVYLKQIFEWRSSNTRLPKKSPKPSLQTSRSGKGSEWRRRSADKSPIKGYLVKLASMCVLYLQLAYFFEWVF